MTIELAQPDPPTTNVVLTFTYYPDKGGKWRWRCRAPNGKIVAVSGESFHSKANAERAATRMASYFSQDVQITTGLRGNRSLPAEYHEFVLQARKRWGSATPLRLGAIMGKAQSTLPNPYPEGSRSHKHFVSGYESGVRSAQ